jgi:hypothetical protein
MSAFAILAGIAMSQCTTFGRSRSNGLERFRGLRDGSHRGSKVLEQLGGNDLTHDA